MQIGFVWGQGQLLRANSVSTHGSTTELRQKALGLCLLMVCGGLLTLPFMGTRTPLFEAYVLTVDTALATCSFVVALLLYGQFPVKRSAARLLLANAFLFVALTTLPQLLRLSQGAFIDGRLRLVTDLALPLAVIAYVLLCRSEPPVDAEARSSTSAIARGATAAVSLAAFAIWLLAVSDPRLGAAASESATAVREAMVTAILVTIIGVGIGMLWWQRGPALDAWLLVALTAWVMAALIQGVAADGTSYTWHLGHLYPLIGVVCVMLAVLADNAEQVSRLADATRVRDRGKDGRRPAADAAINAIANNLNQPLCAITANVDAIERLLSATQPDFVEVRSALRDIAQDAQRVSRTIATAQRLLAGVNEPPADIDVEQLVNECLMELQAELREHRVVCKVEAAPHLPGIRGLRVQLRQMLVNLLTHSLEASPAVQSRDRQLTVRASRHDSRTIAISIRDSGVGDAPRRSGPGLAISRSIVDAHGGNILLTPDDDRGTAFKVILPASS